MYGPDLSQKLLPIHQNNKQCRLGVILQKNLLSIFMPVSILKNILVSLILLMSTPKALNVICLQLRNNDFLFLTAGSTENMMYIASTRLLTYITL